MKNNDKSAFIFFIIFVVSLSLLLMCFILIYFNEPNKQPKISQSADVPLEVKGPVPNKCTNCGNKLGSTYSLSKDMNGDGWLDPYCPVCEEFIPGQPSIIVTPHYEDYIRPRVSKDALKEHLAEDNELSCASCHDFPEGRIGGSTKKCRNCHKCQKPGDYE